MSTSPDKALAYSTGTSPVVLIARATVIEAVRRREFYVLLILMGIFLMGSLAARLVGVENPATGTFILDLGMSLAVLLSQVITLLIASRQVPDEVENRTLYPLLAKPVTRSQYMLGKWLASVAIGMFALGVLLAMGWAAAPHMEPYDGGTLAQSIALNGIGLGAIAALAMLGSLIFPKIVSIVLVGLLILRGESIIGYVQAWSSGKPWAGFAEWLTGCIPNIRLLDLTQRYTGGLSTLPLGDFLMRGIYGTTIAAACLMVAVALFDRRRI